MSEVTIPPGEAAFSEYIVTADSAGEYGIVNVNLSYSNNRLLVTDEILLESGIDPNQQMETILTALDGDDTITSTAVNEALFGGRGNDTYHYELGGGNDIIHDLAGIDTLSFGAGIAPDNISLKADAVNLTITLPDSAKIVIKDWFDQATNSLSIESMVFGDGTVWSSADIASKFTIYGLRSSDNQLDHQDTNLSLKYNLYEREDTINAGSGDDTIKTYYGGNKTINAGGGNDHVTTDSGDDHINGGSGDDYIHSEHGNDTVYGGEGNDTVNAGYGNDIIHGGTGNDNIDGSYDNDLIYGEEGDDYLQGHHGDDSVYGGIGNDTLRAKGGTNLLDGGEGDDTIYGGQNTDTIIGGSGNDTVNAGYGNDIIHGGTGNDNINGSYDNDLIYGEEGDDYLQGHHGDDSVYGGIGNDTLRAEGGTNLLDGGEGDDTIYGGQSTDTIIGGSGNDTVNAGYGNDIIHGGTGNDNINGSYDNDLIYGEEGDDYLQGHHGDDSVYGGIGNDTLRAEGGTNLLDGGEGDDTIYGGQSTDTIIGGSGNDTVSAGFGNDIIHGGTGNDILQGSYGDDTYVYKLGDGNDVISDNKGVNKLVFGESISPANVHLHTTTKDLIITLPDGAAIKVSNWNSNVAYQIENIEFHDGTIWTVDDINAHLPEVISGTSDVENIDVRYTNSNVNYDLGLGDDSVVGGSGDNTYIYNLGDGNDVIQDAGGIDVLRFGSGITPDNINLHADDLHLYIDMPDGQQVTFSNWKNGNSRLGLESIQFADGQVWDTATIISKFSVLGTSGNDTIDHRYTNYDLTYQTGLGDDTVAGGTGDNTYVYNLGDGNDVISDSGGVDILQLGSGITPDNINLHADDLHLYIDMPDGQQVTFSNWKNGNSRLGLESIQFADGQVWDTATIISKFSVLGTSGNDTIDHRYTNYDLTYQTGLGDDTVVGGSGDNTYVYNLGDGNDVITNVGGADTLSFADLKSTEVGFYQNGNDLVIYIPSSHERVTVQSWFIQTRYQMSQTQFTDVNLTAAEINAQVTTLPDNFAPFGQAIDNVSVLKGTDISYDISALFTDGEGATLTFNAQLLMDDGQGGYNRLALPTGLNFDSATGVFSGSLASADNYLIEVTASDGELSSAPQQFTLTVNEANVAPVYQGINNFTVEATQFMRQSVAFTDSAEDTFSVEVANLPDWLSYDTDTQELYGFAPQSLADDINITFTATDSEGASTQATVTVSVHTPYVPQVSYAQLSPQQLTYNNAINYDVSAQFTGLSGNTTYQVELQQTDGSYKVLTQGDWLSFNDGVFSGTPTDKDIDTFDVRVTLSNEVGDSIVGEFAIIVDGPKALSVGTIEQVNTKAFTLDVKQYFSGLSQNAQYGIRIELPESTQQSSTTEQAASEPVAMQSFAAPMMMSAPAPMMTMSATTESSTPISEPDIPEVDIPYDWMTFDRETGLLSGTPPVDFIDELKIAFIANDDNGFELSAEGGLSFAEDADVETYWFTYDAMNQVTIDGGSLTNGVINISTQGQYLEYDAMGRTSMLFSDGGNTAQRMHYTQQGYLSSAEQAYIPHSSGDTNYLDKHLNNQWAGVSWGQTIKHDYNVLGQVTETQKFFEVGDTRNIPWNGISRPIDFTGSVESFQTFGYNNDGKIDSIIEYGFGAGDFINAIAPYLPSQPNAIQLTKEDHTSKLTTTLYDYDGSGRTDWMSFEQHEPENGDESGNPDSYKHVFTHIYDIDAARENYNETAVLGTNAYSSKGSFVPSTTNSYYDANGNRVAVEEGRLEGNAGTILEEGEDKIAGRYFDFSADGKLVRKQTGLQGETHVGAQPTQPPIPTEDIEDAARNCK